MEVHDRHHFPWFPCSCLTASTMMLGYMNRWADLAAEADLVDRDFFLARPATGLDGCLRKLASYADAYVMSQALFREFWSEHYECATLRSWAASVGIEDASCKQLGRWQPSADEGYIRS